MTRNEKAVYDELMAHYNSAPLISKPFWKAKIAEYLDMLKEKHSNQLPKIINPASLLFVNSIV